MNSNPKNIPNIYSIRSQVQINIPFTCDCIDQQFLSHVFSYNARSSDTYDVVANKYYSNLTTPAWLEKFNSDKSDNLPLDARLNVTVNCSCGDKKVSKDYEVFITYPLRPGDSLESVAREVINFSSGKNGWDLLQRYNPGVNFSVGSGIVFVPGRDTNGNSQPRKSRWLLTYISNLGVAFVMNMTNLNDWTMAPVLLNFPVTTFLMCMIHWADVFYDDE